MSRVHHTTIDADNVLVSIGAKHSLFNLFMALIDPGDEVLIPAPYWVSYPDMVMLAGGTPVIARRPRADDDFAVTAAQVAAACTPQTRAIVLNNPSNPTGAVYTRAQIEALAEVVRREEPARDLRRHLSPAGLRRRRVRVDRGGLAELADRTILVDGVVEDLRDDRLAHRLHRVAAALAPSIKAMSKIQGQSTSNPSHIAQVATLAALTGPQDCVETMRKAFDERRDRDGEAAARDSRRDRAASRRARSTRSRTVGAYVGKTHAGGQDPRDRRRAVRLARSTPARSRSCRAPGFGAPGHVRLSYACSMANIEDGVAPASRSARDADDGLSLGRDEQSARLPCRSRCVWAAAASTELPTER